MDRIAINLGTVQKTLLVTLWARAIETNKKNAILKDRKSVEIIKKLDYDFSKLSLTNKSQIAICLRGLQFDRWVTSFLAKNPDGIVVEIGSGLNTRFERVDNGRVRWFDLDLPDSIDLRKKLFTQTTRQTFISASILDPSWIETVKAIGSRPIMFVAEGVLSYLTEQQVKQIFALLIEHFPDCFFSFDSISSLPINKKPKDKTKYYLPKRQWAIKNIREIQTWDSHYQVQEVIKYGNLAFKYYWRKGIFQELRYLRDRFVKKSYRLSLTLVKLKKANFN